MAKALLIVDLEGIPGVDRLEQLIFGGPGHDWAIEQMHAATHEALDVLKQVDRVTDVRIADAHRSGAPYNLDARRFPGHEVCFTDDMYGGAMLDGVTAVACVGMHASARSGGFGAHTVAVHTGWKLGEQVLNESLLVQLLAAERGVPTWFTAGDDVLAREVDGVLPCLVTKHSRSARDTTALPRCPLSELRERNRRLPPVPKAPLTISFQTLAQAGAAVAAGATRASPGSIVIAPRETLHAQYLEALHFMNATEAAFLSQLTAEPGGVKFARQAAALFDLEWAP